MGSVDKYTPNFTIKWSKKLNNVFFREPLSKDIKISYPNGK